MLAIKSPQAYIQQSGIRKKAGEYLAPYGKNIRILTSETAWHVVNSELTQALNNADIKWQLEYLNGECTDAAINRFKNNVIEQDATVIFAVGGGRVLDCAKAAGDALDNVVVINFATVAATCAAWSPIAIIYNEQGGHLRSQPLRKMPVLVLVDSEVIAQSDVRYLKAGIVDALAKWYEFRPYQRHNPESLALDLKVMAAQRAVEAYRQWGQQAIEANQQKQVTPALEKVIDANIVLAGLANSMRDDLPTPGFAHAIHNQLTHLPELHHWLHGEKVGFSLLVQSIMEHAEGQPDADLVALLTCFSTPLRLPAFHQNRQQVIRQLAQAIRFPAASAARLPFTVSPEALEQALLATDTLS